MRLILLSFITAQLILHFDDVPSLKTYKNKIASTHDIEDTFSNISLDGYHEDKKYTFLQSFYNLPSVFEMTDDEIYRHFPCVSTIENGFIKVECIEHKLRVETLLSFYFKNKIESLLNGNSKLENNKLSLIIRDYYSEEMINRIVQVFKNIKISVQRAIPESLAFVTHEINRQNEKEGNYLIINTKGYKTVISLYSYKEENGKKTISKNFSQILDSGDRYYDKIIVNWLETKICSFLKIKNSDEDISRYIFYPFTNVVHRNEKDYVYCDISKLFENVKKAIREKKTNVEFNEINFLNMSGGSEICLLDLNFDIDELVEILMTNKKEANIKFEDQVQVIIDDAKTKKFYIGEYFSMNPLKVQDLQTITVSHSFLHGAGFIGQDTFKVDKGLMFTNFTPESNISKNFYEVLGEINVFKEFIAYKKNPVSMEYIEKELVDKLSQNMEEANSQLLYKNCIDEFSRLFKLNNKNKRNILQRVDGVKQLQGLLDSYQKDYKNCDVPSMIKVFEETNDWFNQNKDNKDVLYDEFSKKYIDLDIEIGMFNRKKREEERLVELEKERIKKEMEKLESDKNTNKENVPENSQESGEKEKKQPEFDLKDKMFNFDDWLKKMPSFGGDKDKMPDLSKFQEDMKKFTEKSKLNKENSENSESEKIAEEPAKPENDEMFKDETKHQKEVNTEYDEIPLKEDL